MTLPQPQLKVSSIIMNEGKVLIGRGESGRWETPTVEIAPFEGIKEATVRATLSLTGVITEPKNVIFVSEVLKVAEATHKVIIYLFSEYVSGGEEFILDGGWAEAAWVDVRELAEYQSEMTDETVDAFFKFSTILRQQAMKAGA